MASHLEIIFLTGAPTSDQLNWAEDGLRSESEVAFCRQRVGASFLSSIASSANLPKWRSLAVKEQALDEQAAAADQFFTTTAADEDFIDHSTSMLEDIVSTEIGESFYSTLSDGELQINGESPTAAVPPDLVITNLRDIPNAARLQQLAPQTMTIHILVGIITIKPPRTVQLRRREGTMELIEVLVGDDTKAGFSITMWLVPGSSEPDIRSLRPRELVIMTNIALSVYRGVVYGQSLSRRITSNETRIVRVRDAQGLDSKANAVSTWSERFLGFRSNRQTRKEAEEALPPDTP